MAKLALIKEGMNFATKQIAAGISAFAPVLTEELHVFRNFLLTHEVEEEEDADDEESLNGDGDEKMTTSLSCSVVMPVTWQLEAQLEMLSFRHLVL